MTAKSTVDSQELDLFGNVVEQARELCHDLDGEQVSIRVHRTDLSQCLQEDIEQLADLEAVLVGLSQQTVPRSAAANRRPHLLATRNLLTEVANTTAVLHRLLTALHQRPDHTEFLAATAVAHLVLHGRLGSAATDSHSFSGPPLKEPLPVRFAALTTLKESGTNVAAVFWGRTTKARSVFLDDLRLLREWVSAVPELRAPDRLLPGGTTTKVARPATPRLAGQVAPVCDYETLSEPQLTEVHRCLRSGQGPQQAAHQARTADRRLRSQEVVVSAARFGIWAQQSLLAGVLDPWITEALGLDRGQRPRPGELLRLVRRRVASGAEHANLGETEEDDRVYIASSWFDPSWQGNEDPVRVFATLYTPAVGAWYQIVRGDVHDLLGLTPMRQAHYAALIAHVTAGGKLSDYAALQGRRYRDVLAAWDLLVGHASFARFAAERVRVALANLPRLATEDTVEAILAKAGAIHAQCQDFSVDSGELSVALTGFTEASRTGNSAALETAYRLLRDRVHRSWTRLLRLCAPLDLAMWTQADIAEFYARKPELAGIGQDSATARARCIATIRGEVTRLLADRPPGAPGTELELLTELHRALAEAMRADRPPCLPRHWQLDLEPGGVHHEVWLTFREWPDIVTVVTTAKQLASETRSV
ncbi:hypothetical protein M8C13_38490 [Crossiella sp. SN42]|uniref:hypothetical protein n=1 Tax=Crossiella sp. SN42 TaxID=2944808 RepID=UPI00207C5A54|nr:hypothetical protein [Crossiella sp. SN42]MCO1581654.1 hypothetical protein [Crossiella sp. SN42]